MSSRETFELATKNIKIEVNDTPVSGGVGNYVKNYEILSTSGRSENNLDFRENYDSYPSENKIPLSNKETFQVPIREKNETIFVNRFSSPGDENSLSVGSRDLISDEYSPYNSINLRNLKNKKVLNQIYQQHSSDPNVSGTVTKVPNNIHQIISANSYGYIARSSGLYDFTGMELAFFINGIYNITWSFNSRNLSTQESPITILNDIRTYFSYYESTSLENVWLEHTASSPNNVSLKLRFENGTNTVDGASGTVAFFNLLNWPVYTDGGNGGLGDPCFPGENNNTGSTPSVFLSWEPITFITKSVYDNEWINNAIPYEIGTSSLVYEQNSDDISASVTGSKFESSLISQNKTLNIFEFDDATYGPFNKLIDYRRNNLYIIQNKKNNSSFHEPVLKTVKPFLKKVKINQTTLNLKETYNKSYFLNDKLNLAYINSSFLKKKKILKSAIHHNYEIVNSFTQQIFPKPENAYLLENRKRTEFIFNPWPVTDIPGVDPKVVVDFTSSFGEIWNNSSKYSGSTWPLFIDRGTDIGTDRIVGEMIGLQNVTPGEGIFGAPVRAQYNNPLYHDTDIPKWRTHQSSSVPFVGKDIFYQDLKILGKNYSLVSEYNFSHHLEQYEEFGNDFLHEISGSLIVTGTSIQPNTDEFFEKFVQSSRVDYNLTDNFGQLTKIKFKLSGLKKFLPYDHLYPCIKTLQIANLFVANIEYEQDRQNIIRPFFGPGILYNTIKSGVPSTFPVLTESLSYPLYSPETFNEIYNLDVIPFEAIFSPYQFIKNRSIGALGDVYVNTVFSGSTVNEKYENSIKNFTDETLEFFMARKDLTYFKSKLESEFPPFKANNYYNIYFRIENPVPISSSYSNTIYTWLESYGPRYISGSLENKYIYFSPYTPPYIFPTFYEAGGVSYYGFNSYSKFKMQFYPLESRKYTLDEIFTSASYSSSLSTVPWYESYETPGTLRNSMQNLSSSFNLFTRKKEVNNGTEDWRWVVSGKWECPVLDYKKTIIPEDSIYQNYNNTVAPKGMWHQYGFLPGDNEGLFLHIDSLSGSISNEIDLAEHLGFDKKTVKLGVLNKNKSIEECVVIIPVNKNNDSYYFTERGSYNHKHQEDFILKYLFPPTIDSYRYDVQPIIMYCAEFTSFLSREDLSRIWQNVQPSLSERVEQEQKEIIENIDDNNLLRDIFNDNTYFKIFKVKKRAKINKIENTSYNWPYDEFSLVELLNVELELEFENNE